MVVISKSTLNEFGRRHADAAEAYVGNNRFVFNIRGNLYRLVALIFFSVRTVYIKFIGTHAEYDCIDVRTIDQKKP